MLVWCEEVVGDALTVEEREDGDGVWGWSMEVEDGVWSIEMEDGG